MSVSKDVQFHDTNPFFNKLPETTSHEECVLDLFLLPRIEINISSKSNNNEETIQSQSSTNNKKSDTKSTIATTQFEETLNTNGDSQVEPQDVSQELHENEPILATP